MNRFAEFMRARDVLTPTIINEVERMEASKDWKRISDHSFVVCDMMLLSQTTNEWTNIRLIIRDMR